MARKAKKSPINVPVKKTPLNTIEKRRRLLKRLFLAVAIAVALVSTGAFLKHHGRPKTRALTVHRPTIIPPNPLNTRNRMLSDMQRKLRRAKEIEEECENVRHGLRNTTPNIIHNRLNELYTISENIKRNALEIYSDTNIRTRTSASELQRQREEAIKAWVKADCIYSVTSMWSEKYGFSSRNNR